MDTDKNRPEEDAEVEEQALRGRGRETDKESSEVNEQAIRVRFRDDEGTDDEGSDAEEDDSDVDEQRFHFSDATLKREITPITSPLSRLA